MWCFGDGRLFSFSPSPIHFFSGINHLLNKMKNKTLEDIKTIDELKEFVGEDELSEEEWIDLIAFVIENNNKES